MGKNFNTENNTTNLIALTDDEFLYSSSNNIDSRIYQIDCEFNYFGIRSGISYSNNEDLSFWEY